MLTYLGVIAARQRSLKREDVQVFCNHFQFQNILGSRSLWILLLICLVLQEDFFFFLGGEGRYNDDQSVASHASG